MAFASPAALVFVIRWFTCGVAPVLRRCQPTVVALRPPPASFDAAHAHISLIYFVSCAASALRHKKRPRLAMRLSAPKAKKIARSATESGGVCRAHALGARPWPFSPPSEQTKPPLCRATGCFLVLRVAFTECPSSRVPEVVIDVDYHQPKPAQPHPRSAPHTGGAIERHMDPQRPAGARRARAPL